MSKLLRKIIFSIILLTSIFSVREAFVYLNKPKPLRPVKVFQIGFNRCGTRTLSDFFSANGIKSIHYDKGKLAVDVWNNYLSNRPLISSRYQEYNGYFDMENIQNDPPIFIGQKLFRELDKQYPGSKFILNIRDKGKWIRSRSLHKNPDGSSYLAESAKKYNVSQEMMLKIWSKEWDQHLTVVLEYFKYRKNDLLVFNIETDKPEKIRDFFKENFSFDINLYKHKHKTEKKSDLEILSQGLN